MATIIAIFIFLAVMGLSINTVKAGQNYNSSKSNTATSIGKIHENVGNILLPYGIGGMEINRVNDALDVGITEDALRVMLDEILGNAGSGTASGTQAGAGQIEKSKEAEKIQAILLEFDKLGIGSNIAIPDDQAEQSTSAITDDLNPPKRTTSEVSAPDARDTPRAGFKDISGVESETEIKARDAAVRRSAEITRENAKELRENFRENVKTTIGHIDHGKTARIAVAHGKGLRMVNRYRSAIARFDHILDRMESRIEKIRIEIEARAAKDGTIKEHFPPSSVIQLIEEAKNMQAMNEAKLVELEAKYESLLGGKISQGIGEEARQIAEELKAEIENLHAKLRQIADDIKLAGINYNSSKSNTALD